MRQSIVVVAALCALAAVCAAVDCSQYTDCNSCNTPECRWVITFDCTATCIAEQFAAANASHRKVYNGCSAEEQYTCLLLPPFPCASVFEPTEPSPFSFLLFRHYCSGQREGPQL